MNKYDIFISYNRATSCKVAFDIYENLAKQGYKVFFELRKRELWEFDDQIRTNIRNAKDVLVLLDEYSFKDLFEDLDYSIEQRLVKKLEEPYNRDYFCKELEFVLETKNVNVVPVLVDGYRLEESKLSDGIRSMANLNAVCYDSEVKVFDGELALKSKAGQEGSPSLLRILEQYENDEEIEIEDSNIANSMTNIGYVIYSIKKNSKWSDNTPKFVIYFAKKSAELGDRYGQRIYGNGLRLIYYANDEGFVWLKKSAEQGDLESIADLRLYYLKDDYADSDEGLELLKKSAEGGCRMSQYWLAKTYDDGESVAQNYDESFYWYSKSAGNGNHYAFCDLGLCYEYGRGVEKDIDKALEWYKKYAVFTGCYGSGYAFVGYCLMSKGDYDGAFKYFNESKGLHAGFAKPGLALCYQLGKGTEKDEAKAFSIWRDLITDENGAVIELYKWEDYFACCYLARCYENGIGVEKDLNKAVKLYTSALNYEEDGDEYPYERFATLSREALARLGVESSTI